MDTPSLILVATFGGVIVAIAAGILDMAVAALLGICVLIATGGLLASDIEGAVTHGGGSLALLFGGMVVARMLAPTGVFDIIGDMFLRATGGSGKRLLLGIVLLVAPVCAFLPNATTVILIAPVIVRICRALEIDFVAPVILTAIVSNTAGMLTLVGDPATFLIGSAVGYGFAGYLRSVSPGGLLAILAVAAMIPLLFPAIWRLRRPLPVPEAPPRIERPVYCVLALLVLVGMVVLFLVGDELPNRIVPPAVAIMAAATALLVVYGARTEDVGAVLRDVDWRTLVFLFCMFTMVEELARAGLLDGLSRGLFALFGTRLVPVGLVLLAGVGAASSLLANIPVAVAMTAILKGYFVVAEIVPEEALGAGFRAWPEFALPAFIAMMFGATLGGNATLIGASANIVGAGICAANGRPVGFLAFMRIGVPVTLAQLAVGAVYFIVMSLAAPAPR